MSKRFKRALSMLLAVILTVSAFPLSILASGDEETGNEPSVQVYYDFAVQNTYSSQLTQGNMSVEDDTNEAFLQGLFDAGTINWIYEGKHLGTVDKKGTGDIGPDFTENMYTATGIQTKKIGYNWWYAIRIQSPGSGTFDVTVNTYTVTAGAVQKHAIWTEAYLFDAAGVDAGTTTIADSLTANNRLRKDFQPNSEIPDASLGNYSFAQGKEYILVLRQTDATYQAGKADGLQNSNLYLKGITMSKQVMAGQQVNYAFNLPTAFPNEIKTSGNTNIETQKDAIEQLYANESIHWSYVGYKPASTKKDGTGDPIDRKYNKFDTSTVYPNGSGLYFKTGGGYNWWYALKLRAPGEGLYNIVVDSTLCPEAVTKAGAWLEAYMLNASVIANAADDAAKQAAIDAAINAANTSAIRLQDFKPAADALNVALGTFNFAANTEYILVLRQNSAIVDAANTALGKGNYTNHIHLSGITMTEMLDIPEETTLPVESTTVPETTAPSVENLPAAGCDFDLLSHYPHLAVNVEANTDYLETLYEAGKISWRFEAKKKGNTQPDNSGEEAATFTKHDFVNGKGMQVNGGGYNWYYALRVKAPGTGTYDLTVNAYNTLVGGVEKHSTWTQVYFFDAALLSGKSMDELLIKDNKLNTFAPTVENPDACVGNVATKAGKDYILVFRLTKDTYTESKVDGLHTGNLYLKGLTFTEAEAPEIPKAGYNFDLQSIYSGLAAGVEDSENASYLANLYKTGKLSWRFEAKKKGTINADGTGGKADTFTKHEFVSGKGIQVNGGGYNWYYAIRVKAPGTGTYDLTVNAYNTLTGSGEKHSTWTQVYFFDAALLKSGKSIDKLLVKDNKIKAFSPTVENPDAYVGNVATKAGKDYILVFRLTKDTYAESKVDGLHTGNLYLKGLTFKKAAPPAVPKTGYDFDLAGNYPDDFTTGEMSIPQQQSLMNTFYKKGYIDWNFYGTGIVAKDADGVFTENTFTKGQGIQVNTAGCDWYYAIRFRSPGKGFHKVVLDSYLSTRMDKDGNVFNRHSIWTEAYILEASSLDNGKTTIADSMLKSNLLGAFSPTEDKPDATLGYYNFKADKEYILVLRQTKKTYTAGKEDGLNTLNLYLEGLKFTSAPNYVPPKADNSKVIYDFDLADKNTGIYPNKTGINDKLDDISRLYGLGELNWKLAEPVADSYWSFNQYGATVYTAADQYVAFRIKSPGKGLYTLSLNHGEFYKGALGAVYILPADTKDIAAAMDTHNRVGMMPFYNDAGQMADGVVDGIHSLVGTWEFGSAKEYIVVVEAYSTSPYASMAYMYISQLICEKGNTTSNYNNEKKINSIVVDPAPVKINHAGTINAVAEINGDDYFFMPQEGRSMSVYNLDTKELVAQVATPFTATRGIAVDEDGYVWLVGANPNIFRYDPYLDVGEWVYYYKQFENTPEDRSGIYEANNAFGLTYADGYLYFGVYGVDASLAKYNIATGEFTHMGVYGSSDANNYPATPVYKDGILYATLAGDNNGDGVKTYEVIKVDAKTDKLLARLDITEHVSQNEVMIRGMGICGDTLLLGGSANDVKRALAVDTVKMEVFDIGVQGFINYYPTKEVNGKCYFLAFGKGMWEFDGATKTATPVKGLEDASVGFRCSDHVTLTVENDSKFPGISYMGFRGSNNMPTLYNMETGTLMVVDDMILDEHGNGQEIRSILKGKGENEIYVGAYRTNDCSVFNTELGQLTHAYKANSDQTDVMYLYKDKLYAGNYNAGVLTQINLDDERKNASLISLKTQYGQARIHTITGGDDYIFCGSVADSYNYSGCLVWINLENLSETVVIPDAVKEQSIISLCYNDGIIFAGSSIYGGTSTIERSDVSARIAVYDVKTQKKLTEIDPRDYIPGLPSQLTGIDAMIADPNIAQNGKIWVHMGARLLCLQYNKTTNKVTLTEALCFDAADRGCHDFLPFMPYLDGNYLYVGFGAKGGLRKVNLLNPSDNVQIPVPGDKMFTLADDGNIYYASDVSLYMYPLNVTDADWAEAEKVDQMIAALGKITVESEEQVKAVRAAYEALSNKHKALIQNIYGLEAAEIDLVEAKIASIGEVTLDDKELIETIKKEYSCLSVKNRTYVKNYRSVYIPALQALSVIIDKAEAARVQALIDTIRNMGEITLEDEDAIKSIRAEYDLLTKSQRALVDATLLLDAEAKIKALRQVRIDRLIQLLANLGDPITLADESAITEAMEIFNWMYIDEREQVDYDKLTAANTALKKLQKAAAAEVDALIMAIGNTVNYASGDAIKAAREAYDALTPGSKEYVKLLSVLEQAEALYEGLFPLWAIIAIVAVAVIGGGVTVVVLLKKRKAMKESAPVLEETPSDPQA